jgi:ZIP Zinc transporter
VKLTFKLYLRWTTHGCQRSPTSQLILSALLCFGAGVLLATALTHMLPEVRSKVEALMEEPDASAFLKALPLTEVLLAAGFFIVYGLDEVCAFLTTNTHQTLIFNNTLVGKVLLREGVYGLGVLKQESWRRKQCNYALQLINFKSR